MHVNVTQHPTTAWVWRQLVNATPWGSAWTRWSAHGTRSRTIAFYLTRGRHECPSEQQATHGLRAPKYGVEQRGAMRSSTSPSPQHAAGRGTFLAGAAPSGKLRHTGRCKSRSERPDASHDQRTMSRRPHPRWAAALCCRRWRSAAANRRGGEPGGRRARPSRSQLRCPRSRRAARASSHGSCCHTNTPRSARTHRVRPQWARVEGPSGVQ
jgi:hypothetical protein